MASSKGRVLHVLDHSFPISDGYAFRSAQIMRFQQALGWESCAVTSSKQGATENNVDTFDTLTFHRVQPSTSKLQRLPVLDQVSVITSLRARLQTLVKEIQPDLLHVHSPPLNGIAVLRVAQKFNIPVVYEIRAFWEDAAVDQGQCREGDARYRLTRAMESYVCRNATRIVTICEGLRGDVAQRRGVDQSKISVVPNAVDVDRFVRTDERCDELANKYGLTVGKTLGFIGSFYAFEGLEVAIRAMQHIQVKDPEARLLLVGGGLEETRLKSLVEELKLGDKIIFTGRVPHSEVEQYYSLIDVVLYPRLSMRITELVTPLKPLEAMAQLKPVLASDIGGHREMIEHGVTGTLFPPENPVALAEEALALLGNQGQLEKMCFAAKEYVTNERNWRKNASLYDQIYSDLLAE